MKNVALTIYVCIVIYVFLSEILLLGMWQSLLSSVLVGFLIQILPEEFPNRRIKR